MKLTFLGKSYDYEPQAIDTANSEFTGRFLGSTYSIRRPVPSQTATRSERKYRGVTY